MTSKQDYAQAFLMALIQEAAREASLAEQSIGLLDPAWDKQTETVWDNGRKIEVRS